MTRGDVSKFDGLIPCVGPKYCIHSICFLDVTIKRYLPGQGIPWHDLNSRLSPTQSLPPKAGRGSVQVRARCCVPVPHDVEHGSQSFQSLHSPSSAQKELEENRIKGLKHFHGMQLWETTAHFIRKRQPSQVFRKKGDLFSRKLLH